MWLNQNLIKLGNFRFLWHMTGISTLWSSKHNVGRDVLFRITLNQWPEDKPICQHLCYIWLLWSSDSFLLLMIKFKSFSLTFAHLLTSMFKWFSLYLFLLAHISLFALYWPACSNDSLSIYWSECPDDSLYWP